MWSVSRMLWPSGGLACGKVHEERAPGARRCRISILWLGLYLAALHRTHRTHTHTPKHPRSILPKAKNQAASAKRVYLQDKWVIFASAYKLKEICQLNCFNQLFFNLTHRCTIPRFWEYWPRLTRMCFSATPYTNRGPHLKQYMSR